jgi:2-alkenal reductase
MHHLFPRFRVAAMWPTDTRRRLLFTWLSLLMLATALLTSVSLAPAASGQATGEASAADVAEQVENSVVTVYTWTPGGPFSPGQTGQEPTGAGSGWVYSDDGLVVTNAHVVFGAEQVKVVTADGTIIPAEIVGTDWYQDVAVLRLLPEDGQELPPAATVGDSSQVRAGDEVIAIGTPLGQFANTVTVGTVGATDRALNTGTGYSLRHLIQHDASLSPGNSGGPLFSMDGEVIGMNVAKVDEMTTGIPGTDEIGFAIDGNAVVASVEEIVATGSVAYPWLGVTSQYTPQGTVISEVQPDSPAEDAGLEPGDVVVAVDGERVDATQGFIDLLYDHEPGDAVTLTIARNGDEVELEVTLGTRPAGL